MHGAAPSGGARLSACAVMTVQALNDDEQLDRARLLCKTIKTVWFDVEHRYDVAARAVKPVYVIRRRGMGKVAERSSPAALVAYLRKQLPVTP